MTILASANLIAQLSAVPNLYNSVMKVKLYSE